MPIRRGSTLRREVVTAADGSKTLELEQRVARLELLAKQLREANAALSKRAAALQAHIDLLDERLTRR